MLYFDPLYFMILAPAILLGLWAQWRVKSAYAAASQIPSRSGITGAQAAAMVLQKGGVVGVQIEPVDGHLSDHYDPKHKVLRLSNDVFRGSSLAALGIAAHEAGHALQDKNGYAPLRIRNGIVPLAALGGNLSWILIMIGLALSFGRAATGPGIGTYLVWGGIALFSMTVLFQLINLPVEFDASERAKTMLHETGLITVQEAPAVRRVLSAAALTYVAATLTAVLTLLYFLIRSGILGGRRD